MHRESGGSIGSRLKSLLIMRGIFYAHAKDKCIMINLL